MTDPAQLREPDLPRTAKVRRSGLRTGWTTGTCAAAAAKAAATALVTLEVQDAVEIGLPSGRRVTFPVASCRLSPGAAAVAGAVRAGGDSAGGDSAGGDSAGGDSAGGDSAGGDSAGGDSAGGVRAGAMRAEAVVVKDAGDDPDVTHGARLTASVSWRGEAGLELDGGVGVGVVTKPGLGLELGGPAINPVPRKMITEAVGEAVDLAERGLRVIISVPDGERMARKTTNGRLGIIGGISILGTTGIVRPFSTASWRASVEQAVAVLAAQGEQPLVLCTGGRTEKGAMALLPGLPQVCFVEVGDFTGAALRRAMEYGVPRVVFVGMAGKLTKLAAGVLMTHYTRSKVSTGLLGQITRAAGGDDELAARVTEANTARHAVELWTEAGLLGPAGTELCRRVGDVLARFCAELTAAAGTSAGVNPPAVQPAGTPSVPPAVPPAPPARTPPVIEVVMVGFSGRDIIAAFPERVA
jgi:cobalt-precorrin-5B (C1)-methyltransferase